MAGFNASGKFANKQSEIQETGEYPGTSCPGGQTLIKSYKKYEPTRAFGKPSWNNYVRCGVMPSAGSAPASAPQINVATNISPTLQQAFTPQFSPNLIQSSGSGSVTAGTEQSAGGGQSGTTGTGDSASGVDFAKFLEAQALATERQIAAQQAMYSQQHNAALERQMLEEKRQKELDSQRQKEKEDYLKLLATIGTAQSGGDSEDDEPAPAPVQSVALPTMSAPAAMPGAVVLPSQSAPETTTEPEPKKANPFIALGIVALVAGGFMLMSPKKKGR